MKNKIVLILLLCSLGLSSQNIIPNAGFEDWVNIDTSQLLRPNYWRLDSSATYINNGIGCPIFQSIVKRTGNYSLALKNIQKNFVLIGDTIRCTFLFKGRPKSLMGYYLFSKNTNANLYIQMALYAKDANATIYNLAQSDTLISTNTNWSSFVIPIQYLSNDLSYKAEIKLYSPANSSLSDSDLVIYLDDFSFSNFNSISSSSVNEIRIYPNPVSEFVYIQSEMENRILKIEISDLTGSVLKTLDTKETGVDVSDLNIGCYIWTIIKDGVVYRGKFIKN